MHLALYKWNYRQLIALLYTFNDKQKLIIKKYIAIDVQSYHCIIHCADDINRNYYRNMVRQFSFKYLGCAHCPQYKTETIYSILSVMYNSLNAI